MKPLERIGRRERDVVRERRRTGYIDPGRRRFTGTRQATLAALLARLLPGVPAGIDLVAFVDSHADDPLGRGDRRDGLPPLDELLLLGIDALAADGFAEMAEAEQRAVIARLRHGDEYGGLGELAKEFVDRLLDKALAGYLAHPDAWARIGFNGPAFPEGYAWIGPEEVGARHARRPGWDRL